MKGSHRGPFVLLPITPAKAGAQITNAGLGR